MKEARKISQIFSVDQYKIYKLIEEKPKTQKVDKRLIEKQRKDRQRAEQVKLLKQQNLNQPTSAFAARRRNSREPSADLRYMQNQNRGRTNHNRNNNNNTSLESHRKGIIRSKSLSSKNTNNNNNNTSNNRNHRSQPRQRSSTPERGNARNNSDGLNGSYGRINMKRDSYHTKEELVESFSQLTLDKDGKPVGKRKRYHPRLIYKAEEQPIGVWKVIALKQPVVSQHSFNDTHKVSVT